MSYLWFWPSGGWDFESWAARHPWIAVSSEQSGRRDLAPTAPASVDDWTRAAAGWLEMVGSLLGEVTDLPPGTMAWSVLETRQVQDLLLERIQYSLTDREQGYAWVMTSPSRCRRELPAVLALHQTVPQGKDETAGLEGNPEMAFGAELARLGFPVLVPDAIGFGERRMRLDSAEYHTAEQFFRRHPKGSVMAKMVYDNRRAVDLMEVLPQTWGRPTVCVGHSHGGYGALFTMLFEQRLAAGVVSCGFTSFRSDPAPEMWWRNTALIPRLGFYEGRVEAIPFDFHHLLTLIAPRKLMIVAGLRDAIFPNTQNMNQILASAGQVYRLLGSQRNLRRWVFDGAHSFPARARRAAWELLASPQSPSSSSRAAGS